MSRKVFSDSESVCWQIGRRNRGGCGGRIAKSDHRKADPSLKKRSVFYKKTTEHHRKVKGGLLFAVNSIFILMGSVCSSPSTDVVADSENGFVLLFE